MGLNGGVIMDILLKWLKGQVKKVEAAWQKSQTQKKIMEAFND